MKTIINTALSNINKALVFKTILIQGKMSRIELSKILSISKMSVTNYVNELIQDGLIQEAGTMAAETGRKPILLEIAPDKPLFVSVQITRHYISVGIANAKGEFLHINTSPTDTSDTVSSVTSKIRILLDQVISQDILPNIWAIGVASMGPVSFKKGIVFSAERSFSDTSINIRTLLEKRYHLPVYVNNDLNALVFAEKYFGNARDLDTFAIVGCSDGLGCGIMIDGQLYAGHNGLGSEFGHITVVAGGEPCYCGNCGCLEQYISVPHIIEWVQQEHKKNNIQCNFNNWQDFLDGVKMENDICVAALDRLIFYLGAGLVTLVNLFDPGYIFLGEYYTSATSLLAERLSEYIEKHQFFPTDIKTQIRASYFTGVSPLIGPAAFAMHMSL